MTPNELGLSRRSALGLLAGAAIPSGLAAQFGGGSTDVETVRLNRIGRYATGEALGGAEIVAFHAPRSRLFVVNSGAGQVEVLDLSDPSTPTQDAVLNASDLVGAESDVVSSVGGTNSVDVDGSLVAAAIEADPATDDGAVAFYDPSSLEFVGAVSVGPLPDKVTITPNGDYVVVANEGEPGGSTDPAGSVSVIDISNGARNASVSTATFGAFDGQEAALRDEAVHLVTSGDGEAVASTVIEPEFVTVAPDGERAFVSIQENNAIATVDLASATVERIDGLGFKDFSLPGNELDTSDVDGSSLQNWPLKGMYQPDAIDAYEVGGDTFVVTANEGDAKDFEVSVLKNLDLDPAGFDLSENPYVDSVEELKRPENLGNMEVNEAAMAEFAGGPNGYTDIYAIGGRSFSVWQVEDDGLRLAFDSGSRFERTFAEQYPDGHVNVVESGPETESAELGVVGDRTFAFIGQEKGSGITAYDVTSPENPTYTQMAVNRDYSVSEDDLAAAAEEDAQGDNPARAGDFAPEGVHFVPASESPIRNPLLCVGFEISGTVGVFEVTPVTNTN
ncbi:choice-of-anchor I family protein [Haloplanus pelagicus]|uniref:choice-of-anchor I family protein n=1 Tax=Haloplanus pelagicus TaxID=2949995 RepID=UPI0020403D1E|nr:choice-of-anchor I family protein [Haloplanus sp. HW8-1]